MNILSKILLVFLLGQTSCSTALAQQTKATLVFPSGFRILLNSYIDFKYVPLEIKKNDNSKIIKNIAIEKPLHLYNSLISKKPSDKGFQSLLLLPGDSIVFGEDGRYIKFAKGYDDYIDNLISIQSIYSQKNPTSPSGRNELVNLIQSIDKTYHANEVKIKHLKIDNAHRSTLSEFNYIVKCASLTNDSFKNLISQNNTGINKILDSIYSEIVKNDTKFDKINSPFINRIYYTIVNYQLQKQGIMPIKKWDFLYKISDLPFFKKFLILSLNNSNDKDFQERDVIYNKIKAANFADSEIDKLYLKLKEQNSASIGISLNDTAIINLVDTKNNITSVSRILNAHKGKIILIDFWASWCIPCREQFPAFKRAIMSFNKKDIAFLNVSIDDDDKSEEWKKALHQEKEATNPNQYRLLDWKNSALTKQLELRTIPRYIVLDGEGKIQNPAYYLPSDRRFIGGLKAYLEN